MLKVLSNPIANSIAIKTFKKIPTAELLYLDSDDLCNKTGF